MMRTRRKLPLNQKQLVALFVALAVLLTGTLIIEQAYRQDEELRVLGIESEE